MATVAIKVGDKPHSQTAKLPVRIRVTHQRKSAYETICYVHRRHFIDGRVTAYDPDYRELNKRIVARTKEVETLLEALDHRGETYTAEQVLAIDFAAWQARQASLPPAPGSRQYEYLLVFGRHLANKVRQSGNPGLAEQYERELLLLERFLITQVAAGAIPVADVPMEELTSAFFHEYFDYLRQRPKRASKKDSTQRRRLAQFMAMVNEAHRTGIIRKLPVIDVKLDVQKSRKRKLTTDAITVMRTHQWTEIDTRTWAVHTFLIQYYLYGARVGDVLKLRNRNIIALGGKPVSVQYYQDKARRRDGKTLMEITVNKHLLPILLLYWQPDKPEEFLLPWVRWSPDPALSDVDNQLALKKEVHRDTTKLNAALKRAAADLGLPTDFSSHSSRHTYAQQAKRKGKSVEFIKESLGHTTYDITAGYLDDLDKDELNANLEDVYD